MSRKARQLPRKARQTSPEARRGLAQHGFCIVPDVLPAEAVADVKACLWRAAEESERRGTPTFVPSLDPNPSSVRVFNLLNLDPVFRELIQHPLALAFVRALVGERFLISNFTANIARPGAQPMMPHSDLAVVFPGPWVAPWSVNVIWCLDALHARNGATRYLPGSHHITTRADLPSDLESGMVPFEAPAGSVLVMDGRLWHTSGANTTKDEERALLFAYYSADFLRPQVNWNVLLDEAVQKKLSPELSEWLGLGAAANVASGAFVARPA